MASLKLPERYQKTLLEILQNHAPDAQVWAYGSRVTGAAHDTSDLDLVLRNPSNLEAPQTALARMREALSDSSLPILVDVCDWARIPPAFRAEIERAHVTLQEPSRTAHHSESR